MITVTFWGEKITLTDLGESNKWGENWRLVSQLGCLWQEFR